MPDDALPIPSNRIEPNISVEAGKMPHQEQISAQKWGHTFTKIAYASVVVAAVAFTVALVAAAIFFTGGGALPLFIALGTVAALSGGGALIAKFFQEKFADKSSKFDEDTLLASKLYQILGEDMSVEDFNQVKNIANDVKDKSALNDYLNLVNERNHKGELVISQQDLLESFLKIEVKEGSNVLTSGIHAKLMVVRQPTTELPFAHLESRLNLLLGNKYSSAEARNLLTNFKSPLDQVKVSRVLDALESSNEVTSSQLQKLGEALNNVENKELKEILYEVASKKLGFNVALPAEWISKNKLNKEQRAFAWFYAANVLTSDTIALGAIMKEFRKLSIHSKQSEYFDTLLDVKTEQKLGELNSRLASDPSLKKTVETSRFLKEISTYPRFYSNPLTHLEKITNMQGVPFLTFGEIADDIENNILPSDNLYFVSEYLDTRVIGTFVLLPSDQKMNDPNAYYAPKIPTPYRTLFQRIQMPVNASPEERAKTISFLTNGDRLPNTHAEIALMDEAMSLAPGLGNKRKYDGMLLAELDETKIPLEHKAALEQSLKPLEQRELAIILQRIRVDGLSKQLESLTLNQAKSLIRNKNDQEAIFQHIQLSSFSKEIERIRNFADVNRRKLAIFSASQRTLEQINKLPDGLPKDKLLREFITLMKSASKDTLINGIDYSLALELRNPLLNESIRSFFEDNRMSLEVLEKMKLGEDKTTLANEMIAELKQAAKDSLGVDIDYGVLFELRDLALSNNIYTIASEKGLKKVVAVGKDQKFDSSLNLKNLGLSDEEIKLVQNKWVDQKEQLALRNFLLAAKELKDAPRGAERTKALIETSGPFLDLLLKSPLNVEDKQKLLGMAHRAMTPEGSLAPYTYNEVIGLLAGFEGKTIYTIKANQQGAPFLQEFLVNNGKLSSQSDLSQKKSALTGFTGNIHTDPLMRSKAGSQFVNVDFNDYTVRATAEKATLKDASGNPVEVKYSFQLHQDLPRSQFTVNGKFINTSSNPERNIEVLQAIFDAVGHDADKFYHLSLLMHQGAIFTSWAAIREEKPEDRFIQQGHVIAMNIDTRDRANYKLEYFSDQLSSRADDIENPDYTLLLSRQYNISEAEIKNAEAINGSYSNGIVRTKAMPILKRVPEAISELNAFQTAVAEAKDINDPDSLEKIVRAQNELLKKIETKKDEPYYLELLEEVNKILSPNGSSNMIRLSVLNSIMDRFEGESIRLIFQQGGSLQMVKSSNLNRLEMVRHKLFLPAQKKDPFFEGKIKNEQKDIGPQGLDLFWNEPDILELVPYELDGKTLRIPDIFIKDVGRLEFNIQGKKFPIPKEGSNSAEYKARNDNIIRILLAEAKGDEKALQRLLILCVQSVPITLKNDIQKRAYGHYLPDEVLATGSEKLVTINHLKDGNTQIKSSYTAVIKKIMDHKTVSVVDTEFDFIITPDDLKNGYGKTSQVTENFRKL